MPRSPSYTEQHYTRDRRLLDAVSQLSTPLQNVSRDIAVSLLTDYGYRGLRTGPARTFTTLSSCKLQRLTAVLRDLYTRATSRVKRFEEGDKLPLPIADPTSLPLEARVIAGDPYPYFPEGSPACLDDGCRYKDYERVPGE